MSNLLAARAAAKQKITERAGNQAICLLKNKLRVANEQIKELKEEFDLDT